MKNLQDNWRGIFQRCADTTVIQWCSHLKTPLKMWQILEERLREVEGEGSISNQALTRTKWAPEKLGNFLLYFTRGFIAFSTVFCMKYYQWDNIPINPVARQRLGGQGCQCVRYAVQIVCLPLRYGSRLDKFITDTHCLYCPCTVPVRC